MQKLTELSAAAMRRSDFSEANRAFLQMSKLRDRFLPASFTTTFKLRHDIDQLSYLLRRKKISASYAKLQRHYKKLLPLLDRQQMAFDPALLGAVFGTVFHRHAAQRLKSSALNKKQDYGKLEKQYLAQPNPVLVVDRLLSDACLRELTKTARESAIWNDAKPGHHHVGARLRHGLSSPLLFQIAEELKAKFPRVLDGLYLKSIWAFKYGPKNDGIHIHSDGGLVNINLWLTPDSANLDQRSGGMTIYLQRPPKTWSLTEVNSQSAIPKVQKFIRQTRAKKFTVPYAYNRAVIFDSRLFHQTDKFLFKDSYLSRRVSLTFLFDRASQ